MQSARVQAQVARDRTKVAEYLTSEMKGRLFAFDEACTELSRCFRGAYTRGDFPAFEKDAMALFGVDAVTALNEVRGRLGMPEVLRDFDKVASHIPDTDCTPAMAHLKVALAAQKEALAMHNTLQKLSA